MPSTAGGGLLAGRESESTTRRRVGGVSVPTLLFAAAAAVSAGLLLLLGSRLTFLLDDWEFLVYRPGFTDEAILGPHNEHIVVIPILVYKALLATAGMDSALPYRAVSTALFIISVALLYVYLRRRIGAWLALVGAASILFLGAAWEDLLWPFQMGYFGSMACGLGMLLALERPDRRADLLACVLLALSLGFSSLGIPFVAAALVAIAIEPAHTWARRAFVVAVPVGLFAIWWLGWGREAETSITLSNLATAPLFVIDGFASSLAALFGLSTPRDETTIAVLDWGRPLLAAAVILAGWRLWVLGRVPRPLLVVVALALCFWLLGGINEKPGRSATASRYVYVGAICTLMIAGELLRGVRLPWRALAGIGVVAALAIASNVSFLHQSYKSYRATSELERADLGALEIARDSVDPAFRLDEQIALTAYVGVEAGPYLAAVDEFGSPAYTPAEIAAAPEPARRAADLVLSRALGITFTPAPEGAVESEPAGATTPAVVGDQVGWRTAGACVARDGGATTSVVELPPGGATLESGGGSPAEIHLRRFAVESFTIEAGRVSPGAAATLVIPEDRAEEPWELEVRSNGPITICGRGA